MDSLSAAGIDGELKAVIEKEQQKMMFQTQVLFILYFSIIYKHTYRNG